jgi:uncharacterized protein (TIGR02266 family)
MPAARRRKSVMRPRRLDINLEFDSIEHFISEYVSNISKTGAFIRTRDPWPVGTKLRLRFTILADELEILEGMAEVVRVSDQPRGMGVAFVELAEHSAKLIDKLLDLRPALRRRVS